MKLIIGLGNPGEKYEKTRHNIGFRAVDKFQRNNNFPEFSFPKKFQAEISKGILNNEKIIIAKPQTFMNLSGKAIKALIKNYKLETKNLIIVHDDIDLPLEKIRIVKNRGAGGHRGVESIIQGLGTKNFIRFRIGIKPNARIKMQNEKSQFKIQNVESFVLKKFTKDEERIVEEIIKKTAEAVEIFLKEGLAKAQGIYNI